LALYSFHFNLENIFMLCQYLQFSFIGILAWCFKE